jgi:hypothetical protein
MAKYYDISTPRNSLSPAEAEELFSKVDNSGHTNEEVAERQRRHRKEFGHGVDVDPLSLEDPSGSNVGKILARAGAVILVAFIGTIVFIQIYVENARIANTANLSNNVNVRTVADALDGGVEWGSGFTQFPQDFSVQEADQNTGRIEVTVIDTTSKNALMCFSNGQIQSTAFSVSSLLNPQIDTVIYHVHVHRDAERNIQRASFFGFFMPTGEVSPFTTFIWTKTTGTDGQVRLNCTVTGVDDELQDTLRKQIVNESTNSDSETQLTESKVSSRH